jgi:hypothetical protein
VVDLEDEKAERPMRGVTREVARAKAEAGSPETNLEEALLAAFFNLQRIPGSTETQDRGAPVGFRLCQTVGARVGNNTWAGGVNQ